MPNFKGKVGVGLDSSDTDFNSLGKIGGEKTHTLTNSEIPNLSINTSTSDPNGSVANGEHLGYGSNSDIKSRNYTINTNGNQSHNNLQPYTVVNYIIKAKKSTSLDKVNIITGQEFKTGRVIDGKEEYGLRVDIGALPNTTVKTIDTGLDFTTINMEYISGMATRTVDNAKTFLPIPNNGIEVWLSENNLKIDCSIDRSSFIGYVVVYYTKEV